MIEYIKSFSLISRILISAVIAFMPTGDDPCTDIEILNYMKGLVGQNANYSIIFQNCRSFSQDVFNKYKKGSKK